MEPASAKQEDSVAASYVVRSSDAFNLPASYRNLIFAKWLRSLRYGNDLFRLIDPAAYYPAYHKFITAILGHADCVIRLAVLSDEHDVVLGFSVSRGEILDYVHVHRDMRRQGIARKLLPDDITTFTHITKNAQAILKKQPKVVWKFNPFV